MKRTTVAAALGLLALAATPATAQQVTGTPGSPHATTTLNGKQLPPPDPKFGGVIKERATESTPWWPPGVVPPKGAPNILLIMTDDSGFGAPSTFGGVVPTPAMDRIAKAGLRYTNFHSTSLCSPSRAALITGRNHHVAGFGVVGEIATGFPGYDSVIRKENGTIGAILKENGYATSWFGKNHNTPFYQATSAGPFDQWPDRHGIRVLLRLRRRRHQPVAAEPVPQHDGHLPVPGQSGLEPDHGDGRRSDSLHEGAEGGRARQAVPRLLRARRHARAASSDEGMGRQDQRHAPVRRRLEQDSRDDLRQPEATGHHASQRAIDALAEGAAAVGLA